METILYLYLFLFVYPSIIKTSNNVTIYITNTIPQHSASLDLIQMNKNLEIEEISNLDYKIAVFLNKSSDLKTKEIIKDVSAIKNFDGGKPMI